MNYVNAVSNWFVGKTNPFGLRIYNGLNMAKFFSNDFSQVKVFVRPVGWPKQEFHIFGHFFKKHVWVAEKGSIIAPLILGSSPLTTEIAHIINFEFTCGFPTENDLLNPISYYPSFHPSSSSSYEDYHKAKELYDLFCKFQQIAGVEKAKY